MAIHLLVLNVVSSLLLFGCVTYDVGKETSDNIDRELSELTNQITRNSTNEHKTKIGVIAFSDLDGNTIPFGKFLAEELITPLFNTGKFQVVERRLLNKIAEEHKLNFSNIIDETTAKKFGRILGVDSIVSGTVSDFGNSLRINARLISTQTGSIFAVAAVSIHKEKIGSELGGNKNIDFTLSEGDSYDLIPHAYTLGLKSISWSAYWDADNACVNINNIKETMYAGNTLKVKHKNRKCILTLKAIRSGEATFSFSC